MQATVEIKSLLRPGNLIAILAVLLLNGLNIFLISKGIYYLSLLPVLLFVVYLLFFKPGILFFLIAAVTPLSINYLDEASGFSVFLPTEPLLLVLMVTFLIRIMISGEYDKRIWRHPVSIIILAQLAWIFITAIFSTMPLVSFKFFLVRLWYVTVFYFMGLQIFRNTKNIKLLVWLYAGFLVIAVSYTLFNHAQFYFVQDMANKVTKPFFKDHTVYGATLALIIPFVVGFMLKPKSLSISRYGWFFSVFIVLVMAVGIIFSYTRAAWVSLLVSLVLLVSLLFGIKFKTLALSFGAILIVVIIFWSKIIFMIGQNDKISSTDFKDHVESISNISSDPSNSERINRWKCAVRMFREKPLTGWGPGTYMFKYAPFQRSYERTIISTNFGNLGNAHSEYLGPLAETGILGMLIVLVLTVMVIYKGIQLYYKGKTKEIRILSLLSLLCLVTYFAHGLMNNFLDTDKASVPFWSYIAFLTAVDLYHKKKD